MIFTRADKRLEKLGYLKNKSACYGEDKGVLLYEKPMHNDIFQIEFKNKKVWFGDLCNSAIITDKILIKAIVAKMDEMGW